MKQKGGAGSQHRPCRAHLAGTVDLAGSRQPSHSQHARRLAPTPPAASPGHCDPAWGKTASRPAAPPAALPPLLLVLLLRAAAAACKQARENQTVAAQAGKQVAISAGGQGCWPRLQATPAARRQGRGRPSRRRLTQHAPRTVAAAAPASAARRSRSQTAAAWGAPSPLKAHHPRLQQGVPRAVGCSVLGPRAVTPPMPRLPATPPSSRSAQQQLATPLAPRKCRLPFWMRCWVSMADQEPRRHVTRLLRLPNVQPPCSSCERGARQQGQLRQSTAGPVLGEHMRTGTSCARASHECRLTPSAPPLRREGSPSSAAPQPAAGPASSQAAAPAAALAFQTAVGPRAGGDGSLRAAAAAAAAP